MNRLTDTFILLKETFFESIRMIRILPLLLAAPALYLLAYLGLSSLNLGRLGSFSGILFNVGLAIIVSSYLYILHQALYYKRFRFPDILQGVRVMFLKTLVFLLVYNLLALVLSMAGLDTLLGEYAVFIPLLLLNPMPEIIYLSEYSERDMVMYNFVFIKENILPWYALNLLLVLGLLVVLTVASIIIYLSNILLVVYLGFAMVFRGMLFKKLHHSNPRKRRFQRASR